MARRDSKVMYSRDDITHITITISVVVPGSYEEMQCHSLRLARIPGLFKTLYTTSGNCYRIFHQN